MQIREGWTVGIGALFGAAAAIVGLLLIIQVAPENAPVVGTGIVLAGLSRILFYESGGVVHPIRNSPGYDPSIEKDTAHERARHAQEARYRGVERERGSQVVERPPWAAGLSERHLLTIAKAHGQSASSPRWWEKAGLYESEKRKGQKTGELRDVLREGGSRRDTRLGAAHALERREVKQTRQEARRIAAASALGGRDLPF
jgi:hypothetical protein